MNKKSQLTLFIIIGIILLFSTALIIYLQQQVETTGFTETDLASIPLEMQPVKQYVDSCLKEVANEGILYMGTKGGYLNPPLDALETESAIFPYYYRSGINAVPSLITLENEISSFIEVALPSCTDGFQNFTINIEEGDVRATTRINDKNTLIKVYYPLNSIIGPGKQAKIENFVVQLPIRIGKVRDVADKVVNQQVAEPNFIDLTYLSGLNFKLDIIPFDESTTIVSITDKKSKIDKTNYKLFFANEFDLNSAPIIEFIPDFTINQNDQFDYQIRAQDADGDVITYSDNTNLFEIDSETGIISFSPTSKGVFETTIIATDSKGKSSSTEVIFKII